MFSSSITEVFFSVVCYVKAAYVWFNVFFFNMLEDFFKLFSKAKTVSLWIFPGVIP